MFDQIQPFLMLGASNMFLNKDDNTIRFTKANLDARYSYDELETKLEIKGKNELIGKEPDNVNVTYKRI